VVGGLLCDDDRILLVANRRRRGQVDWTPPGGVVDRGEEPLAALSREVVEETGLVVATWEGPCYLVQVDFVDRAMRLDVEVHRAMGFEGRICLDDPDGIVEDARFVDADEARWLLETAPPWVRDPVESQLEHGVAEPLDDPAPRFAFVARGTDPASLVVERIEPRVSD